MPSKTSRESRRNDALLKLDQKKKALAESRLRHVIEIIRIDHTLKEIEAEYRRIVNEASPLLHLPMEVTCTIFDLCVTSHSLVGLMTEKRSSLPEVVISHVCTHWREIALNYPQLWTRFHFRTNYSKPIAVPLHWFDAYMERSGSQNLDLFFDFRMECEENIDTYQLMGKAFEQVKRWKTVTLQVADADIQDPLLDLLTTSAPNLEYFAYSLRPPVHDNLTTIRDEINSSHPRIFQGGAPKLRYLRLNSSSQTRLLPFGNITTLRVETDRRTTLGVTYSWETFLEILSVPSLVNLSMFRAYFAVPARNEIRIVTMNNLKHLRYGFHTFMTLLLPFIRAPLLETLSISSDIGVLNFQPELGPFLFIPEESYFFPSLQTLILIDSKPFSPDSIWRVMQLTKNVTSILISHINLGNGEDHFFDALRKHGRFDGECWPNLNSLTAIVYPYHSFETITEFLLSRPKDMVTLRLFRDINLEIQAENPDGYKEIQENCTVKVLTVQEEGETPFFRPLWPPEVDCPEYAFDGDPFNVRSW